MAVFRVDTALKRVPLGGQPGDRRLVDLADRGGGQRRQRNQDVGAGVHSHPTLVEVAVQLRQRHRLSYENDCSADLFTEIAVRYWRRRSRGDRRVAEQM